MKLSGILQIVLFALMAASIVFNLLGWAVALIVAFALAVTDGVGLIALAVYESSGPGGVV